MKRKQAISTGELIELTTSKNKLQILKTKHVYCFTKLLLRNKFDIMGF